MNSEDKKYIDLGMLGCEKSLKESHEDILSVVEKEIGVSDRPIDGPSYILPNGKFLTIWRSKIPVSKYSASGSATHRDVQDFLYSKGLVKDKGIDVDDPDLEKLGCIRVNSGFEEYIWLPDDRPNEKQWESLLVWLDWYFRFHSKLMVGYYHYAPKTYYSKDYTTDEILKKCKEAYARGYLIEDIKENILDALDKEFGQEDVYMWSTYILPNGHFLNPDNSKWWDEINEDPVYEHADFEDWAWSQGYTNLQDIWSNCIKMNVTSPYLGMPDKAKPTQEQLRAVREILNHQNEFYFEQPEWDNIQDDWEKMGPRVLGVFTPYGDRAFDLDVSDSYDIIREINQAYVRGGFFGESVSKLDEDSGRDTFIFKGKKAWSGAVNTLDGTIEEVHSYSQAKQVGFHHSFYFSDSQLDKMDEGDSCFFCVYKDHTIMVNATNRFNSRGDDIELREDYLKNRIREQIKFIDEEGLVEKIVKKGNKWQVQSEKGRNLGTYDTKKEAEDRLKQVHYFKHMNESNDDYIQKFKTRTQQHIDRVNKYAKKIDRSYPNHDSDKFNELFDGYSLMSKDNVTDEEQKLIDDATYKHVLNNEHHCEHWCNPEDIKGFSRKNPTPNGCLDCSKMPESALEEMCCDWCAMSEEFGNTPFEWYEKNKDTRWHFNEEQDKFILDILHKLWDESLQEDLDESTGFPITVYTYQKPQVRKLLESGETYIASYNRANYNHYKDLARVLGLNNCPIFGALSKQELYEMLDSSGIDWEEENIIHLEIPKEDLKYTEYYDWTDYMYALEEPEEFEEESGLSLEDLENLLRTQKGAGEYENCQVVFDRIESKWYQDGKDEEDALNEN